MANTVGLGALVAATKALPLAAVRRALRDRFPESKYADEIRDFDKRYAMHRAAERIKNLDRFGRSPKSEAERRCAEAWRYERFGDLVTAWDKYEALVELFGKSEDEDDRAFANLAKRQLDRIEAGMHRQADRATFVQQHLDQAASLAREGHVLEARRKLRSIVSLYEGNQELRPLVEQAREQMNQLAGDIRSP